MCHSPFVPSRRTHATVDVLLGSFLVLVIAICTELASVARSRTRSSRCMANRERTTTANPPTRTVCLDPARAGSVASVEQHERLCVFLAAQSVAAALHTVPADVRAIARQAASCGALRGARGQVLLREVGTTRTYGWARGGGAGAHRLRAGARLGQKRRKARTALRRGRQAHIGRGIDTAAPRPRTMRRNRSRQVSRALSLCGRASLKRGGADSFIC